MYVAQSACQCCRLPLQAVRALCPGLQAHALHLAASFHTLDSPRHTTAVASPYPPSSQTCSRERNHRFIEQRNHLIHPSIGCLDKFCRPLEPSDLPSIENSTDTLSTSCYARGSSQPTWSNLSESLSLLSLPWASTRCRGNSSLALLGNRANRTRPRKSNLYKRLVTFTARPVTLFV